MTLGSSENIRINLLPFALAPNRIHYPFIIYPFSCEILAVLVSDTIIVVQTSSYLDAVQTSAGDSALLRESSVYPNTLVL